MSETAVERAILGPLLIVDDINGDRLDLAAIFVAPKGVRLPALRADGADIPPEPLLEFAEDQVWRARFTLPSDAPGQYEWNGQLFEIASQITGDLRIAYASCNGEEHGDLFRNERERNAMWARLCDEHKERSFGLLLHGGDQIYADEATQGHPLSDDWPDKLPRDPLPHDLDDLRNHLRQKFLERYKAQLAQKDYAWLVARVPSLAQWDDHDICDGWGSLPRSRTYSAVGTTLFEVAREAALAFQHGTIEGDLPARFRDPSGYHLGWQIETKGLRILAPDLRSERTRRQVMGLSQWEWLSAEAARPFAGRTLVMSSVPLLGPRLSLLELLLVVVPKMQKYEDDLRDQWQSRAHRASWQKMLRLMMQIEAEPGQDVTILSGEIHLATWARMRATSGKWFYQLVASGITHRAPPQKWARALHLLAALGETPLPGHPIRIERIPGQKRRYVAERNALFLGREGESWKAHWLFEQSGLSPALKL